MLIRLDTFIIIQETDNQDLPHLINLEVKQVNKKKKKLKDTNREKLIWHK